MKNYFLNARNVNFLLIASLFISVALFSSCDSSNECQDAFDTKEFVANKKYCLSGSDYFTLDSINDSRCPANVVCVWEGQVTMKTKLITNGTVIDTIFVLQYNKQNSYILGPYKFTPKDAFPFNTTTNGDLPRRIVIEIKK
jgi:archaellum component FlaF (FlaF/FlaG flagellin family)